VTTPCKSRDFNPTLLSYYNEAPKRTQIMKPALRTASYKVAGE